MPLLRNLIIGIILSFLGILLVVKFSPKLKKLYDKFKDKLSDKIEQVTMPWKAAGAQVVETIKDTPVIKDVIPEEAKKDLLSGDPVKMITSAAVNPINFVQTAVNEPKKMGKSVEKAAAPAKKALKTGVKEVQKLAKKISKGRLF